MKKLLLLVFFISTRALSIAQAYGNEWIDPTRPHYKIEVTTDGIYRIPFSTLNAANLAGINPKNFILFHNGQSVPIYVSTTSTSFGTNDYIEFYGKQNRGEMDEQLYRSPDDQMNPSYSLFTNTSIYYLTTNNLPNNPRLSFVPNSIPGNATPEKYFMYLSQVNYPTGMYYNGKYVSLGVTELYKSIYDQGEGYTFSQYFGSTGLQTFTALTPSVYQQGPSAIFRTRYANNSAFEEHDVKVSINGNEVYHAPVYNGFHMNNVTVSFPVSYLTNNTSNIGYQDNGNGISQNKNVVGALSIEYPRSFDFSGLSSFYFQLDADGASNKYLEITSFQDQGTQPILYDLTNGAMYRAVPINGVLKYNLNYSAQKRELCLRADNISTYYTVTQLTSVTFTDFTSPINQGEYFIITEKSLTNDGGGHNYVEDYRKYRDVNESPTTGKFLNARIADIDLLYDQFGYGIRKSPLAIRNFINYMSTVPGLKTKYVFLIGKGREAPSFRNGGSAYNQCLVPTFGYPGSDNLLAATQVSDTPKVAIGRLAAQSWTDVRDYLEKMREYEAEQNSYVCNQDIPSKQWQKEILHFSGGTGAEQFIFRTYVDSYKKIAEDSLWGAQVTTFSKNTNDPISVTQSQAIKDKINQGVSWITFFGHSATGAFDFSIDEPENYTNTGRYPIMLSNGCFSGFIHDATKGYSERFVLQADKGVIAFMATSSLSAYTGLNNFSYELYKNTCINEYNQPLGKAMQHTLTNLFQNPNTDELTQMIAYEMTLHGDPGLKPNHYPKPDFALDASSVFTTPLTVTPGNDSFDVNVVVTNLGKSSMLTVGQNVSKEPITVNLKRTIFDASGNPVYYYYNKSMPAPFYSDTVAFTLPVNISTQGYGQNLFEPSVDADADNKVAETAEAECNNKLQTPVSAYIQSDDIIPIYPYEFAIVPKWGFTLKASTVNPFAPLRSYRFQIDTSELFNSPAMKEGIVTQVGGVVRWTPDSSTLYKLDSAVYYWRVKKDSIGALWHYSSFVYLNGEYPGWNQSHYYQYQKDEYQNVNLDVDRTFKFPPSTNQIHVRTGRANAVGGNVDYETLGWDYNNYNEYRYRMGGCGYYSGGLTFAVIDPVSGAPWYSRNWDANNFGDQYGNVHCSNHSNNQNGFDFPTTGTNSYLHLGWDTVIQNFINSIPNGFFVLMYSVNNPPYTSWSPTLVSALQQLGFVTQPFTSGATNGQLVFFTQKGNVNYSPFYAYTNGTSSILDTTFNFQGVWFQGSFNTPKIGPAVEWQSVHWKRQTLEGNGLHNDVDSLDVIGVRTNGADTVLFTTALDDNLLGSNSPAIDAAQYPYLKLRLHTLDDSLRTPTQLYYWRVLYKKPPEAAINPAAVVSLNYTNQVNQGANFHLEVPLENVTEVPMDSMLTKYVIRDANFNNVNFTVRYDSLPGLDTMLLILDYPITSNNYLGLNKIIIEANPDNDQIEQYHFNNIAEINFGAVGDKINPLLDVTFDNQHILNGDIVSAKPNILITLKDENKFLALDNEALIDVYIKYPGATEPTKLVYDNVTMKFYPADSTNLNHGNKAQVELKPIFTIDGTYELLVKDRDRSGNNSATTDNKYQGVNPATFFDYKISFEVITKPMITNVLNYPNPFTTNTHFVFTITGSEVPDFMKIQIINIKGTVVKEIFKEELGPLHIGKNITEYAWDGRDQYGDLLANGIYFYHVSTRLDDKQMDAMSMSYDKYFKKGFGKMAIVR